MSDISGEEHGDVGLDMAPADRWAVTVVGVTDSGVDGIDGLYPTLALYFQGTDDKMTFLLAPGTALGVANDLIAAVGAIDHPTVFAPDGEPG